MTSREPCERCGQVHEKCTAHRNKAKAPDGRPLPCNSSPMRGQTVCAKHGGKTPVALRAAAMRLAQAEAAASLADVEVRPIGDPLDALAHVAAEAVALKNHFADIVAELGDTLTFTKITSEGFDQKLDARVALYERALDRCHRFLSDWVRLGFEDRKVQLDEIRTARVVAFVRGVLADHNIAVDDDHTRQIMRSWQPVLDGQEPPR